MTATIRLTEKQARSLFDRLHREWWSDGCTAAIDDAMRTIDVQLARLEQDRGSQASADAE